MKQQHSMCQGSTTTYTPPNTTYNATAAACTHTHTHTGRESWPVSSFLLFQKGKACSPCSNGHCQSCLKSTGYGRGFDCRNASHGKRPGSILRPMVSERKEEPQTHGMISLLIELCHVMQTTLVGFGLDYVKRFDLIPQQVVLLVAKEEGMDEGVHRALSGMYAQLMRCFKIMACMCSFFQATNGILQGCPLSVILINSLTSIWKRVMDAQAQAIQV